MTSGDPRWPLDDHTRGKHLVLKAYLDAWFPIVGSWSGRILFIDGFAGPGEYVGGEPGSPLIALRTFLQHRWRDKIVGEVVFLFIENDPIRAAHLERLVEPIRADLPPNWRVHVRAAPFDETMTEALDALERQNRDLAPAFVMVDPFGIKGTPMSVLERILNNPRSEVYVSFMFEWINRFLSTPEFEPHLDQLFGSPDWRPALDIADSTERKAYLYDLYERRLRIAGAEHVLRFEVFEDHRLVYAIFFGTKSNTGSDRMKQAIWKVVPGGDFAFRRSRSGQIAFDLSEANFEPLKDALRSEFGGQGWVTIEDVLDFVASDRTDYHTGQVRKNALIPMENDGSISVDASSRRKRRTYPDGTRLRFLS